MKRLNLDLDDELFSEFKAHCARKGLTMREEVIKLVSSALENDEKEVPHESKDMIPRPLISKGSEELEEEREQRGTSKAALILAGRDTDKRFENIDEHFGYIESKLNFKTSFLQSQTSYLRNHVDEKISSVTAYINDKTHRAEMQIGELQDTNNKIEKQVKEFKEKVQNIEKYLAKRDPSFYHTL